MSKTQCKPLPTKNVHVNIHTKWCMPFPETYGSLKAHLLWTPRPFMHECELCRKVHRAAHSTNLGGYGSKLCQQEFYGKPCSLGTGDKSWSLSRHNFFGNLSHWADWRLLAQVGVMWPECCTLTNQVLGEADGTSCQTLATSTNNQTLHSIVSGDTPCLMYSTNWKSNN